MALEEKHHQWFGQHPNAATLGLVSATKAAPAAGATPRAPAAARALASPAAASKSPQKAAPPYGKWGQYAQVPPNSWTGMRLWNFLDGSAAVDGGHLGGLEQKLFLHYLDKS